MHLEKQIAKLMLLKTTGKYYYTQAVNANKLLEASELSLEKIKQAKLKTDQSFKCKAKIERSAKKK
jgi:hypothetical protein